MEYYPYITPEHASRSYYEEVEDALETLHEQGFNLAEMPLGAPAETLVTFQADLPAPDGATLVVGADALGASLLLPCLPGSGAVEEWAKACVGRLQLEGCRAATPIVANSGALLAPMAFAVPPALCHQAASVLLEHTKPARVVVVGSFSHADFMTASAKPDEPQLFQLATLGAKAVPKVPFLPQGTFLPISCALVAALLAAAAARSVPATALVAVLPASSAGSASGGGGSSSALAAELDGGAAALVPSGPGAPRIPRHVAPAPAAPTLRAAVRLLRPVVSAAVPAVGCDVAGLFPVACLEGQRHTSSHLVPLGGSGSEAARGSSSSAHDMLYY